MTKISNIFNKYSKAQVISYFQAQASNSNQLSLEYLKDPIKTKILLKNVVIRHLELRDAYSDPSNPKNVEIIKNYYKYLWDSTDKENAQLRGPQFHLSSRMSEDFGRAGNGIEKTNLSAEFISSLIPVYTVHKPVVELPLSFKIASPDSAQQSHEVVAGTVLSGFTGNRVYLTGDNPNNIPQSQYIYNNMPSTQSVGDFAREIIIVKNNIDTKIISREEHKTQSINIAISPRNLNESRVVSIGTVDISEEKNANRIIAQQCLMGIISIKHQDPYKNNAQAKNAVLNKIIQTGDMVHAKEYIGIPFLFSNKYHDPNNS